MDLAECPESGPCACTRSAPTLPATPHSGALSVPYSCHCTSGTPTPSVLLGLLHAHLSAATPSPNWKLSEGSHPLSTAAPAFAPRAAAVVFRTECLAFSAAWPAQSPECQLPLPAHRRLTPTLNFEPILCSRSTVSQSVIFPSRAASRTA